MVAEMLQKLISNLFSFNQNNIVCNKNIFIISPFFHDIKISFSQNKFAFSKKYFYHHFFHSSKTYLYWCPENCPEENWPPVRVRVWFRISIRIRAAGQFSWGAIFLEPFLLYEFFIEYFSGNHIWSSI